MNSHSTTQSTNSVFVPAGATWARLHSEREDVCAALLGNANEHYGFADQPDRGRAINSEHTRGRMEAQGVVTGATAANR